MASHLETTDVPLLHGAQYLTLRGRITTLDPNVPSVVSSEYWEDTATSHGDVRARGLGHTLRSAIGTNEQTPQMSSGRSRATQQETSSTQKIIFTRLDRRSVCGEARASASRGYVSTQQMGWNPYKRNFLRTRCAKGASIRRLSISCGKSLETKRTKHLGSVERVAVQVRQLDSSATST